MKKIILLIILLPLLSFSQSGGDFTTVRIKEKLISVNGDTLLAPYSGEGNYFKNVKDAADPLDAVNLRLLENYISNSAVSFKRIINLPLDTTGTPIQDLIDSLALLEPTRTYPYVIKLDAGNYFADDTITLIDGIELIGSEAIGTMISSVILVQSIDTLTFLSNIEKIDHRRDLIVNFDSTNVSKILTIKNSQLLGNMYVNATDDFLHYIQIRQTGFFGDTIIFDGGFIDVANEGFGNGFTVKGTTNMQVANGEINDTIFVEENAKLYLSDCGLRYDPQGISLVIYAESGTKLNIDGNTIARSNTDNVSFDALEIQNGVTAGTLSPKFIITENPDGTIDISDFAANIYNNVNQIGKPRRFNIDGVDNQVLSNNLPNFISIDYNGGDPILRFDNSDPSNESNILLIAQRYREGTILHGYDLNTEGEGLADKINRRLKDQSYFTRTSGLLLDELPTRIITSSEGKVYIGSSPISLVATNSSTGTLDFYAHVAGIYTKNPNGVRTQYVNDQYDNGTNLQTLLASKFVANYIFRDVDADDHILMIIGGSHNSLQEAVDELVPGNLPSIIVNNSIYLGKIIVQQSQNTAASILSVFTNELGGSSPTTEHDYLNGIKFAGTGITYGHINDDGQSIAGIKTFSDTLKNSKNATIQGGSITIPNAGSVYNYIFNRTSPYYEILVSSNGQNNFSIPFSIKTGATIFYKGNILSTDLWSGEGTTTLTVIPITYINDRIIIKND